MKASQLVEILQRHPDDDVVIRLQQPSVGTVAHASVKDAHYGHDWESGMILLSTEERISMKTQPEEVWHAGMDFIHTMLSDGRHGRHGWKPSRWAERAKAILLRAGFAEDHVNRYMVGK